MTISVSGLDATAAQRFPEIDGDWLRPAVREKNN